MKSVFHIAVILNLLFVSIVFPQRLTGIDSLLIPLDSNVSVDSMLVREHVTVHDSLTRPADSTLVFLTETRTGDSLRTRFLAGMGQITDDVDTLGALHQRQFVWTDAKTIGELIWKLPGFFYRDLGEAGKWGQLNAFGLDGRTIGIFLDGRPMNDPVTGTYNLSDLPLEFLDHTEILMGTVSAMALSGTAGTALNFVSRSYNSYRPLTKLRFVQDPKGTIFTDGLFTQNIARGLNLMIGFQRHVTDGRYINANLDAWNVRTRVRYNISDRLNVALTDFYTKAENGLNGGVNRLQSESIFTEAGAIVNDEFAWDHRSRRDLTMNALARILPDSSSTTQTTVYYSTLEREYYNPSLPLINDFTQTSFWGARLQQQLSLEPLHCTMGISWERRKSDSTKVLAAHKESEGSLFVQAEMRLTDRCIPSLSVRSISLEGESSLNTGAGIKSVLADWLTVFADASWYDRYPTFQERYWRDSTFLRSADILKEQHTFLQAGFTLQVGSNYQIGLTGFKRTVKRAIVFQPALTASGWPAISISNAREVMVLGINGSAQVRWHPFEVLGVMTLTRHTESDTLKTLMPEVILAGEASYHNTLLNGKLEAKVGVRSRFCNRQQGAQFDPHTLSYVEYITGSMGRSTTLDLFLILKIGEAHISLSWGNVLNAQYILSPVYPMPGRNLRLGVNWVFLD